MSKHVFAVTEWTLAGFLCVLLAATGCVQQKLTPNATLSFDIPSKISVIKKGARVKVFTSGNMGRQTRGFVRDLTRTLNEAGWFTIVSKKPFDYAMNINTFKGYRRDNRKEVPYNLKVIKKSQTDKSGSGREFLVKEKRHSAIGAYVASVSIYKARTLEPMVYFNSVAAQGVWEDASSPLPTDGTLEKKLAGQIVKRMRNLLSTEHRQVGVILPDGGDQRVKDLLVQGRVAAAAKRAVSLVPRTPLADLSPGLYEKWADAADEARKQGNEKVVERDMETDLNNFYLLFMAKEASGVAESRLREVHDGYAGIVALTENQNLIDGCAHSLSRVEQNARRLNVNLSPE
ncbi:hypothetical protein [Desulfoplanes sp.]